MAYARHAEHLQTSKHKYIQHRLLNDDNDKDDDDEDKDDADADDVDDVVDDDDDYKDDASHNMMFIMNDMPRKSSIP